MNVYDKAHELATAIKSCREFQDYDKLKKEIDKNEEVSKMIKDFQAQQFAIQAKQMSGEDVDADMNAKIQELYQIILKDPTAAQYMQAEMRFSIMMNDVYQILGEAMGVGK